VISRINKAIEVKFPFLSPAVLAVNGWALNDDVLSNWGPNFCL